MGEPAMTTMTTTSDEHIWGSSSAMQRVRERILRVAGSDATVLVVGESGSGKDLVARQLHESSARSAGPFLALDCGAQPAARAEAGLFGTERGPAGDGPRPQPGALERAHRGTLFLDHITALSAELQTRLLRVLETGRLQRVGGRSETTVDVRIVAATHHRPTEALRRGLLREDLYYRLAVYPILIPPLRERGDDALEIAQRLLDGLNAANGGQRRFSAQALQLLREYAWPGNVRELRSVVERGFLLSDDDVQLLAEQRSAAAQDLPGLAVAATPPAAGEVRLPVGTTLEQAERALIEATLSHMRGNKSSAAQTLGCSLKTLYNKLNSYAQLSNAARA